MQIYEEMTKDAKAVKKLIYRPPLPQKKQLCVHYKGRSGKVKIFTEEEIFVYKCKLIKRSLKNLMV